MPAKSRYDSFSEIPILLIERDAQTGSWFPKVTELEFSYIQSTDLGRSPLKIVTRQTLFFERIGRNLRPTGIRNRLMNEFREANSPPLPFPLQHALTQTVATAASAQGALELMTIWAGQNASLRHSTDATDFMTQLIAEAASVFSKYWEAVSAVRETGEEDEA